VSVLVIDASVVLKWCLHHHSEEQDSDTALAILEEYVHGRVRILQPVHWLAEAAAVLARVDPELSQDRVALLQDLEIPVTSSPEIWYDAVDLACGLRHHVFDTLYHAVARATPGSRLVTADDAYFSKASNHGSIVRLAVFDG